MNFNPAWIINVSFWFERCLIWYYNQEVQYSILINNSSLNRSHVGKGVPIRNICVRACVRVIKAWRSSIRFSKTSVRIYPRFTPLFKRHLRGLPSSINLSFRSIQSLLKQQLSDIYKKKHTLDSRPLTAQRRIQPRPWPEARTMAKWPSHMWYLMQASEVSPKTGRMDEPRVTGKNIKAKHMVAVFPSLNTTVSHFVFHLPRTANLMIK